MDWVRAHPYVAGAIIVGSLLVIGSVIVSSRTTISSQDAPDRAWSAVGGRTLTRGSSETDGVIASVQSQALLRNQLEEQGPYNYLPAIPLVSSDRAEGSGNGADIESVLASLLTPHSQVGADAGSSDPLSGLKETYAFIPHGLVGTTTQYATRSREEARLYEYGNRIGALIRSFEESHANMPHILKDTLEDPENAEKLAIADRLGEDFVGLGRELVAQTNVPPSVAAMHNALALSYQEVGAKLTTPMHAESDAAKLQAFADYNASAERFTKAFVALATYFEVANVRFSQQDPGSVFIFTANPSL